MVKEDCPLSTAANLEPTPTIPPDKLSPADVLLYRRHSLLGRLIRAFDGKGVSHAALYLGSEVAEAVGAGCCASRCSPAAARTSATTSSPTAGRMKSPPTPSVRSSSAPRTSWPRTRPTPTPTSWRRRCWR